MTGAEHSHTHRAPDSPPRSLMELNLSGSVGVDTGCDLIPLIGNNMSIVAWIVVGIIAGWLAERITGRNHGLFMNLIVGIIGAFLGGFLVSSLLGFQYSEGFNLPSIVVATVGAIVLLAVFGGFRNRSPT